MATITTHNLGYPRIGAQRELKKATEAYWKGTLSEDELLSTGKSLREENWRKQQAAGIDFVPVNDFSFYDQMLDMSCLLGNIPPRFSWNGESTDHNTVFTLARGTKNGASPLHHSHENCSCQPSTATYACEMTKWFDTNYHYLVPEFSASTQFKLANTKVFDEFAEAQALGLKAKPVLVGPVTYLSLGKLQDSENSEFQIMDLIDRLLPVYVQILQKLEQQGAEWIQLDEPIFALDLSEKQQQALLAAYETLTRALTKSRLLITSYFGALRDNLDLYLNLPVAGLHFDFVRGSEDLPYVLKHFPENKILSAGFVEGRNIWKNDYQKSLPVLQELLANIGADRLWIAPSCSLIHVPVSLEPENKLDPEIKDWLAFADEKLSEISELRGLLIEPEKREALDRNAASIAARRTSTRIHNPSVKARLAEIKPTDFDRQSTFKIRQQKQAEKLQLPVFPTTSIGSFPQTTEVRKARAQWKKGMLSDAEYDQFLKAETARCVAWQEEIGIDMPVHGEFERNDMVEYFGENLEGFTFTSHGWVQSYGSRYVKPPVIFGDVSRPKPMTTYWSGYAQSLTKLPMKGMLTGPVTILQWSFVRDDQPRSVTTHQIALAIRDEVVDLENVGIAAIQIDEPALREGLPLRKADWENYLHWAVAGFKLSASGVKDDTQIHTHMCYAEFNDIIQAIANLDADVITIETSRSNMELLKAFVEFAYPNEIGPGVYDIHSPRVPTVEEILHLMRKAEAVLPRRNLWINPDCGLKTRHWDEVKPALVNLVSAAKVLRAEA